MERYLVLNKHNEITEVEGEEYIYDNRLFLVTLDDTYALFDKRAGIFIASSTHRENLNTNHVKIVGFYDKVILSNKYRRDCKKFDKLKTGYQKGSYANY